MAPRSPRKKRIHIPGAARRFVAPAAAAAAAAVAATAPPVSESAPQPIAAMPAAEEAKPIDPPVMTASTAATAAPLPPSTPLPDDTVPAATTIEAASTPPAAATVSAEPPVPQQHMPPPTPPPPTAAVTATPRRGMTRRSRQRKTRRGPATSLNGTNGGIVEAVEAAIAKTDGASASTPTPLPSPVVTAPTEGGTAALAAPAAPAAASEAETLPEALTTPPQPDATPTPPPPRAIISRLPKKKFFAELDGSGKAAEGGVKATPASAAVASAGVPLPQPPHSSTAEVTAAASPTPAAPPRRAAISRVPKKRAKVVEDVSATLGTPAAAAATSPPSVASPRAAPPTTPETVTPAELKSRAAATAKTTLVPPAASAALATAPARVTISRVLKKKKFFADLSDDAAAAEGLPSARPPAAEAAPTAVAETCADASPAPAAATVREKPCVVVSYEVKAVGDAAAAAAESSMRAGDVAAEAAVTPSTPAPAPRKPRTKPRKQAKRLSPAAQCRREIAALNRIPRRFRPPTPLWDTREVGKAGVALSAADTQSHPAAEAVTLPVAHEGAPSMGNAQSTVEGTMNNVVKVAASLTEAAATAPAPTSANDSTHVADKAGKRHITRASAQGRKRFFTTLEEAPSTAAPLHSAPSSTEPIADTVAKTEVPEEAIGTTPCATPVAEAAQATTAKVVEARKDEKAPDPSSDPVHPPTITTAVTDEAVEAHATAVQQANAPAALKSPRGTQQLLKRGQRRSKRKKVRRVAAADTAPANTTVGAVSRELTDVSTSPAPGRVPEKQSLAIEEKKEKEVLATSRRDESAAEVAAELDDKEAAAELVKVGSGALDNAHSERPAVVGETSDAVAKAEAAAAGESTSPVALTASEPAAAAATHNTVFASPESVVTIIPVEDAAVGAQCTTAAVDGAAPAPVTDTGAAAAFPSTAARRLAAKRKIKKHAKLAAARLTRPESPPAPAETPKVPAAVADTPLVDAIHANAEPPIPVADAPSAEMLLRNAALTLPSGQVVIESFTEQEMVLRRATLDNNWDVGLRFDWQARTLSISAFPEFDRDDVRASHPFVKLYKSKPRWLLKEVNEADAAHMKEALDAMKRSLTARFVFRKLAK